MKIAVLSTPWISVPPQGYGGIELVVANLCEGLVLRGHEVELFATGDSTSSAQTSYFYKKSLGNDLFLKRNPYNLLLHTHAFFERVKSGSFDIIHNNAQYFPIFFCDLQSTPFVHTLHGAFYKTLKSPSGLIAPKRKVLEHFKNHPFVSISDNQRHGIPELNYVATVYNGIRTEKFKQGDGSGGYLAWLGRVTPNKGLDTAIEVARSAGIPLKISAFVDKGDQEYFDTVIEPLLGKNTELISEIKSESEKNEFLGKALGFLFPIRWDEPFGLVMVEAMATGTPVIAFPRGSAPEIVKDGKTGFLVNSTEQMIDAVSKLDKINRSATAEYATGTFSVDAMVEGYIKVYEKIISMS